MICLVSKSAIGGGSLQPTAERGCVWSLHGLFEDVRLMGISEVDCLVFEGTPFLAVFEGKHKKNYPFWWGPNPKRKHETYVGTCQKPTGPRSQPLEVRVSRETHVPEFPDFVPLKTILLVNTKRRLCPPSGFPKRKGSLPKPSDQLPC